MACEVLLRYFLRSPTIWALELSAFVYGGAAILVGGYTFMKRGHVRIDLLYARLPDRARIVLDIFADIVVLLVGSVFFFYAVPYVQRAWRMGQRSASTWGPPLYPIKTLILIGVSLLLLQGLVSLILNLSQVLVIRRGGQGNDR